MRLLVLFALIGLSVAVPVYEDPENSRLCDHCKRYVAGVIPLVKRGASQEEINRYIDYTCNPVLIIGFTCRMTLLKAVEYLKKHPECTNAKTVCKALRACKK
ncbi:unnamed protein product [Calicophoron daubneyi]|uniref:Saposin B-type domain-containing protein n=1 Tax=Calicophoron daubneyi TaxID=300641 RepID=A0AAV2T356_CALDB